MTGHQEMAGIPLGLLVRVKISIEFQLRCMVKRLPGLEISQLTNLCTGIRSQPLPISRHLFRCSFGCVLLWNQIYLVHNVPFDNITPIYLINLPWKLGLGLRLDLKMHYFSIFHGE